MTTGQGERLPPSGAATRPAATVVLVREGSAAMEVLLLRRNRATGFVPGAYVFPGGRVDRRDSDADILARIDGLDPARAARRLDLPDGEPPAIAYYVAAAREAFEEAAILVGAPGDGRSGERDRERFGALRDRLMTGNADFGDVLDELGARLDASAMEYIAHWITPDAEPRRYDTRFFAAVVPPDTEPDLDPREMVDAVWLSPEEALERRRQGTLPMIFPTIRTLEALGRFDAPEALLDHYRATDVPALMPVVVRTPDGVEISLIEEEG